MERKVLQFDRELVGHATAIGCLALSSDGITLLSGDDDALVIVWNTITGEATQKISCVFNGPVSAITWIDFNDCSEPAFVFGCADGSLHLYKRKAGKTSYEFASMESFHDSAIESLAFDPIHCRIASTGGGVPQVWKVSAAGTMVPVVKPEERSPLIARSVLFCDDGASVAVCYLESHEIICFTIEPWGVKWSKTIPTRIGNAFLCASDGLYLFITNLVNGIDQYKFPSLERVQSFPHAIDVNQPLQISTMARGSLIVCGGDSGFARVFDRRTGQMIQRLEHEKSLKQIPTLTVNTLASGCLVVTGEAGLGDCKIRLWREVSDANSPRTAAPWVGSSFCPRLSSGVTGIQAVGLGFCTIICWQIFVAVSEVFFNLGGFSLLGRRVLSLFKLSLSFAAPYYDHLQQSDLVGTVSSTSPSLVFVTKTLLSSLPTNTPSIVFVTETSFATVTSIVTSS